MAKAVTNLCLYVAIAAYELQGNKFTSLRVDVDYRKGKGFYVSYHAGWGSSLGWGCMFDFSKNPLTDTTSVLVLPANKNSSKVLVQMQQNLKADIARKIIGFLFNQRNFYMLNECIKQIAINPDWATEEQLNKLIAASKHEGYGESDNADIDNENNSNNINNNKISTTMAQKNVNADNLVGRVLVNEAGAKYTILKVNGDKLNVKFEREGSPMYNFDMAKTQIDAMLQCGAHWQGEEVETADTTATDNATDTTDDVEEVNAEDVDNEPKAEPIKVKMVDPIIGEDLSGNASEEEPKAEPKATTTKRTTKARTINMNTKGALRFETYKTKRTGELGGKIIGFTEGDPIYNAGRDLHAAKTWVYKNGNRIYGLMFGPKYRDAAKEMCDAINERGADLEECANIINSNTENLKAAHEERKAKYEQRKAEREAEKANKTATNAKAAAKNVKMYTEDEVKERIRNAFAVLAKAMKKDVSVFEPIIKAA